MNTTETRTTPNANFRVTVKHSDLSGQDVRTYREDRVAMDAESAQRMVVRTLDNRGGRFIESLRVKRI